jgi:hypothetical protein
MPLAQSIAIPHASTFPAPCRVPFSRVQWPPQTCQSARVRLKCQQLEGRDYWQTGSAGLVAPAHWEGAQGGLLQLMMPRIPTTLGVALVVCVLLGNLGCTQPMDKKLIEYGWDVPAPSFVAAKIAGMEQRPFDGVIMRVPGIYKVFTNKKWADEELNREFAALEQIQWQGFTDNFIMMFSASDMDWFSDADWAAVLRNVELCAKAARLGRCKGVAFDPEPYGKSPWTYNAQPRKNQRTLEQYQQIVRRRGAQFVDKIEEQLPAPVIHTLFMLGRFEMWALERNPAELQRRYGRHPYGLYPAFVNGMLDAADPDTIITDGNEGSYYYTTEGQFLESFYNIRQRALSLIAPENQSKYRAQVECAQALYVDHVFDMRPTRFASAYMTLEQRARWFEHNVYYALSTSDRYVWLYSEKMNWWTGARIPPGLPEAISSARDKLVAHQPLGFEIADFVARAEAQMNAEKR